MSPRTELDRIQRLGRLRELAHADVSVLLGRDTSEHEQRIVAHVVDLMFSVAHNVEEENVRLRAQLLACEQRDARDGDGPQMAVCA